MDKEDQLDSYCSMDEDSAYHDAESDPQSDGTLVGGMQDEKGEKAGSDCERKLDTECDSEPEVVRGGDLVSSDDDDELSSSFGTDLNKMIIKERRVKEIGNLVCATLTSRPDGADPNQLKSCMMTDWGINMDLIAVQWFDYNSFPQLLASSDMEGFVEVRAIHGEVVIYGAKVTPLIQDITQTIADEQLSAEQRKQKRKRMRLVELKKPENQEAFIEGKRRILGILLDFKAFEERVPFMDVQAEYMKRFGVNLNAQEQLRLFHCKSAQKNLRNAFHKEVDVFELNPMVLKLKSKKITLPTELSEEDRERAVGLGDVEMPVFRDAICEPIHRDTRPPRSTSKDRQSSNATMSPAEPKKSGVNVTMSWGEADSSDSDDDKENAASSKSSSPRNTDEKKYFGGGDQNFTSDEESDEKSNESDYFENQPNAKKASKSTKNKKHSVTEDETAAARVRSNSSPKDANEEQVREPRSKSSRRTGTTERALQKSIQHQSLQQTVRASEAEWKAPPSDTSLAPSSSDGYEARRSLSGIFHEEPPRRPSQYDFVSRTNNQHHDHRGVLPNSRPRASNHSQLFQNPGAGHGGIAQASGSSRMRRSTSPRAPTYARDHFQRAGPDFGRLSFDDQPRVFQPTSRPEPSASQAAHSFARSSAPSSEFANRLNVATQTDSAWLDIVMLELGYIQADGSSSAPSSVMNMRGPDAALQKLAHVVDMIIHMHAPSPVVLTDLPRLVEGVYGNMINPVEDRSYRVTWQELIERYCSRRISIIHLPGHCDIIMYRNEE